MTSQITLNPTDLSPKQNITAENNCIFEEEDKFENRTVGKILVVGAQKNLSQLANGNDGQILSITNGKPAWVDNSGGGGGGSGGGQADSSSQIEVEVKEDEDSEFKLTFVTENEGTKDVFINNSLSYNPNTQTLSVTNVKGNVTGNVSGTAGGLSSTLTVDKGGTGLTSLKSNNFLVGNETGNVTLLGMGDNKGGLIVSGESGVPNLLEPGTNNFFLKRDDSATLGVSWQAISSSAGGTMSSFNIKNGSTTFAIEEDNTLEFVGEGVGIAVDSGNKKLTFSVDTKVIYIDQGSGTGKTLLDTSSNLNLDKRITLFEFSGNSDKSVTVAGGDETTGMVKHLFFDKSGTGNLTLNFGTNNLMSGSGQASTLLFNTTGQSATVVYIGSKWRIINTGAVVSYNTEELVS